MSNLPKRLPCKKPTSGEPVSASAPPADAAPQPELLISIDLEWETNPRRPFHNHVLRYGLRLQAGTASVVAIREPKGPDRKHRLSLAANLGHIIAQALEQKILSEVPRRLTVLMHYGRGDLAGHRDFGELKTKLDALKGTFATTRGGLRINLDLDPKSQLPLECLPAIPDRRELGVPVGGRRHEIMVTFRDTHLLVPEGRGSLAELVGVPKRELPPGHTKCEMGRFFKECPVEAELYLRADLEIPVLYYQRLKALLASNGISNVPPTLGACAVAWVRKTLPRLKLASADDLTPEILFGLMCEELKSYDRRAAKVKTRKVIAPTVARGTYDYLFGRGYHGGRTETYCTGPSPLGLQLDDIDLKSAYPSAMAGIRPADFDSARMSTDVSDYTVETLGVADVSFSSPEAVRYPPLGVRAGDLGLIFPRQGRTVATAPEIAVAVRLGVEVTIHLGVVVPPLDEVRPYRAAFSELLALRTSLKVAGNDLEAEVVKTITNSAYGKTAQAVRPRNIFDPRSGEDRALPPSPITSPAYASYTTGLVRAAIAELLNGVPEGALVISVSTDGFLTSASVDQIDQSGPACQLMSENRRALTGDPSILELKKRIRQAVTPRNRAAFTVESVDGFKPVLARGSIKPPADVVDNNHFLLGTFLDRNATTSIKQESLISLRAQWQLNSDLVSMTRDVKVNLEPDWKRRLIKPEMAELGGAFAGRSHLSTQFVAFNSVEEMIETRRLFDQWRDTRGKCLKNLEDWHAWEAYRETILAMRASGRRPYGASDPAAHMKRQFLRALARGECGLRLEDRSYAEVATWLTVAGYPTSRDDVRNSKRGAKRAQGSRQERGDAPLIEHSVAAVPAVLELLKVLVAEYPTFQWERILVVGHEARVREALGSSPQE